MNTAMKKGAHAAVEAAVEIVDLAKRYGKQMVLQPLSWRLKRGTCVAFCGGNGAGKSTLIQMLAGIIQPSQGKIWLFGRPQDEVLRANRRGQGPVVRLMPDQVTFSTSMTVREVLSFYARLQGVSNERVEEVLAELGLEAVQNRRVSALSKGMTQRLLLAQAILKQPDLLLLDEPANGLDPVWSEMLKAILKRLQRQGTTIVFSSHQLADVQEIADEVLLLYKGKLLYSGTLDALCKGRPLEDVYREKIQQVVRF